MQKISTQGRKIQTVTERNSKGLAELYGTLAYGLFYFFNDKETSTVESIASRCFRQLRW